MRRRPGASPLLFGRFLMELGAFVSLEDISDALPSYEEEVLNVEMDPVLASAYKGLEEDIKAALEEHRGNQSVVSIGLNALMLYSLTGLLRTGTLYGHAVNPETGRARTVRDLASSGPRRGVRLREGTPAVGRGQSRASLRGRRVQIFAVYTQKRDVTQRLKSILSREGIRARSFDHRCTAGSSGGLV